MTYFFLEKKENFFKKGVDKFEVVDYKTNHRLRGREIKRQGFCGKRGTGALI